MDYKVYVHRRLDNNEIFYVGHGYHARPWANQRGRSKDWLKLASQYGRLVEIVARYTDKELAASHEILYIAACREMGIPIINKRSGGSDDRRESISHSEESRQLMRVRAQAREARKRIGAWQ